MIETIIKANKKILHADDEDTTLAALNYNEESTLIEGELESLLKGFLFKPPESPKRDNVMDKTKMQAVIIPGGGPFNQNDYLRITGEPISPKERTPSRSDSRQ